MVECDYCGEEFENERELHIHWGKEHEDELNSHQKGKMKKARRKQKENKETALRKRKQLAGWGFAGVLALAFIALVGTQLMNMSPGTAEFDLEDRPMLGDEDAPVQVVAFEDYRCPHCKAFETQAKPSLDNYIETGDVSLHFLHFPVLGSESQKVAVAAECVYQQDEEQFWNYHDAVFQNQEVLQTTDDYLVSLAEGSTDGLDYSELRQCIDDRETQDQVNSDRVMGQQSGVSGTPTVFVNGERINDWSYNNLRAIIDAELE